MPDKITPLHELLSTLRSYFQEADSTRKYADEAPPLRAELYNIAQIEHYGMELARTHKTATGRATNILLSRLDENDKILHEVRDLLVEAVKEEQLVSPAGEWLLDNFYLVEEHISTGRQHLPKGYSEGLPRLLNGPSAGLPRVYDIVLEVIAHSDGRIDIHNVSRFIQAYQKVTTLQLGELWAIPIMLRLALIENLRRVAARIAVDRINQKIADHWSDLMIETSEEDPKSLILVIADMARSGPPMESSFVAELVKQLTWKGPTLTLPLTWMEQRLSEQGITTTRLVDMENQKQAADQVSISNTISSLRFVNTMDWRDFVEDLSTVEVVLKSEQSGVYATMDFTTRDHYRHVVERIAKYSPHSETEVAKIAVTLADEAKQRNHDHPKRAHVGYYLVGKGVFTTEEAAAMKPPLAMQISSFFKHRPLWTFAGSITLFSLLITYTLLSSEYTSGANVWFVLALSLFTLIAISQLVIALVNWVVTLLMQPDPLPRLDMSKQIPEEHKTLVTIPTLITSPDNVVSLIDGLEIRYLANCKKNIYFALLTDFADAEQETLPQDAHLLALAEERIAELNSRYGNGEDIFFLFHRPRNWNANDKVWMAYERKRGKLGALNRLLRMGERSAFSMVIGDIAQLQGTKYIITLDTDTRLPRDTAWKMIATMAHPLNQPEYSKDHMIVKDGYGILQPRVGVNMPDINSSLYLRLYANDTGVDPYTNFTSDVYQDMFKEGSFIGKGIYDIETFEKILENKFPENRILSHDLIEGCYLRSGLVSDVQLYEDNPGKFSTDVNRRHRWIRGDWQIAYWALPVVPDAKRHFHTNPLSPLSRWKIFDNLRRSLVPLSLMILLMIGWGLGYNPIMWTGVVLGVLALPSLLASTVALLRKPKDVMLSLHVLFSLIGIRDGLLQACFSLACLPFEAYYTTDAIIRTGWRMLVSHQKLLQWKPTGSLEHGDDNTFADAYKLMWVNPALAVALSAYLLMYQSYSFFTALPLILMWLAAPAVAWRVSRKATKIKKDLSYEQISFLQKISRKTWAYFEAFVNEQNNWLPPDNFQETPKPVVAHRTSPTNIGLALLSNMSAYDFGYITSGTLLERTANTFKTMGLMERYKNHFYNWYDTISLQPLPPKYVSAVDSGNLAGHLIVLKQGLLELPDKRIITKRTFEGIRDTLFVLREYNAGKPLATNPLREYLATVIDAPIEHLSKAYADITHCLQLSQQIITSITHEEGNEITIWAHKLVDQCNDVIGDLHYLTPWLARPYKSEDMPEFKDVIPTLKQIAETSGIPEASANANARIASIHALAEQCETYADIEYEFLYDRSKHLLAIGYNVDEAKKDSGNYDLLASEARLTNFVAIAQNKIPQQSWFALGRSVTENEGSLLLLSWSGSMFEYLMPLLVMPTYEQTLLHQTYRSILEKQIDYGKKRGVPWGISESGYNAVDTSHNYQYKAFGVPGTGLKRGLVDDLVIAPYASVMGLMVMPSESCDNLHELSSLGFEGKYGFYEAIDYTPSRIPRGQSNALIRSFMVHHQGMSLLSLSYLLHDQPMQRRFEAEPRFQATLLLLQEKMTKVSASITHTLDITDIKTTTSEQEMRLITTPHTPIPEIQLLSNGRYNVMLTNSGGGYSRWNDIAVTRWREDAILDNWGTFCYIRDAESDKLWSNTYQPTAAPAPLYEAIFTQGRAEFKRSDNGIETHTEVVVSPEDDIELRRIKLINRSRKTRTLEITSYTEIVMTAQAADEIHPSFSNLFVQTTLQQEKHAIMATRRPRAGGQKPPWMCHTMKLRGIKPVEVSYETSRADFVGRGNSMASPRAVVSDEPLRNNAGSVLDPIASIKYKIVLEPGEIATFDMINGMSPTEDGCQALIDKYQDKHHAERVLELAWTHSQVVLRQINATEADAQLYGRLASSIIYMNPQLRAEGHIITSNFKDQSGLWGYSISGDIPIVLLKIREGGNMDIVKQLVQAHAYWRMKGLFVDLVIWNEDAGGYRQNVQEQISGLISAAIGAGFNERTGSIYFRQGDQVSKEDRILFETVARIILTDDKGTLADQVNRKPKPKQQIPYIEIDDPIAPLSSPALQMPADIDFYNSIGGFSANGKEYIIHTDADKRTPAPWANVIANPFFGTIVSESGRAYTWVDNAHEQRLTPWHNDPVCDRGGEQLYLRDEMTGYVWSPTPMPTSLASEYITRHGFGYSVFLHNENGISSELWVFVDIERSVKFSVLKLKNTSGGLRKISATGYVEWVMGDRRSKSAMHIVTEVGDDDVLFARNRYSGEMAAKVAFFDADHKAKHTYTCDRNEFIGRNGSLYAPDAMLRESLSNKAGAGFDTCAAIQVIFDLIDGEEKDVTFRLGVGNDMQQAMDLANTTKGADHAWDALEKVKAYWNDTLSVIQVESPDKALNIIANGWLMYQTLVCRFWARSGYYQSGGAFGFRDQLQDALALMYTKPELARQQILLCASRQFEEGDVQHWWHPPTGRGVRTTCSDDYLWLPFVTARYVEHTGDSAILDKTAGFLKGRPLNEHEESYFDMPQQSDKQATLYDHCRLAIDNGLRFGEHGLPLIGSGDWNDGMDKVGEHGKGESVWLGFFLYDVLQHFCPLATLRNDADFIDLCTHQSQLLKDNINNNAWDGEWYRRAYFDDGTPLGSSQNEECSIDSISQSWSVLSGAGKPEYTAKGMEALYERLVDKENGLIQLLDPPFDKAKLDPGYIKGYVPGVRENGGQYSHAAIWTVMAFAAIGDGERTWELLNMINPVNHGNNETEMRKYKVEPYVMAADVYKVPSHLGRGGWTWYTGSAGWMYQCIMQSLLGMKQTGDTLSFAPCLPSAWDNCKITYRYKGAVYHIVINGNTKQGIARIKLNGEQHINGSIKLKDDLKEYHVEISYQQG